MKILLKGLVYGYRIFLRPILSWGSGGQGMCRYEPSCSAYFLDAVEMHGSAKGSWIGIRRIFRCHPWGGCGYDPVPPVKGSSEDESSVDSSTESD